MRWIRKRQEPPKLAEWRETYFDDPNFGYDLMRKDKAVVAEVEASLCEEQGGICAYTGIQIQTPKSFHVEHIKAQAHCSAGEEVDYQNVLACYPAPGAPALPFGAQKKGSWPPPQESHQFISPLQPDCEARFRFSLNGEISADQQDLGAHQTIDKLGLDHPMLQQMRAAAIKATLAGLLDIPKSKTRLAGLIEAERSGSRLEPFCFVLKQGIELHLERLAKLRSKIEPAET